MSAKAIGWVFDHSPYAGARLVLHLALADVANDTYENELWMSAATMAHKARMSERYVFEVLAHMVDDRLLLVVRRDPGRPVHYRLLMAADLPMHSVHTPLNSDAGTPELRRAGTHALSSPNPKEGMNPKNAGRGAFERGTVQPPRYTPDNTPGEPIPDEVRAELDKIRKRQR